MAEKNKIKNLEDELNQLRKEMASFIKSVGMMNNENLKISNIPQTVPPPPPLPPSSPQKIQKRVALSEIGNIKRNTTSQKQICSFSEILKTSNKDKSSLRRVEGERSPGGTLKKLPKPSSNPTNNTEIIAQALRKKFKNVYSPTSSPGKEVITSTQDDFDFE